MKTALFLCAVAPNIGGVLIRGEKGTAKSTTVRALAELLPQIDVVCGCPLSCDSSISDTICWSCNEKGMNKTILKRRVKMLTLPLNATEDRVSGGLDFESAVRFGKHHFSPGLLAQAHQGILYVDEVNLLDDHLVDLILDAAATGVNRVEREGISVIHSASFVLVGTMNPEEGELRPQLLDRFGLCVDVSAEMEPEKRVMLMQRREAFDADPKGFERLYIKKNRVLSKRIENAKGLFKETFLDQPSKRWIVDHCRKAGVAGHRADIFMQITARAHAAWNGRGKVEEKDLIEAAGFVLPHRIRERTSLPPLPSEEPPHSFRESGSGDLQNSQNYVPPPEPPMSGEETSVAVPPTESPIKERIYEVGKTFGVRRLETRKDRFSRRGTGRRSRTRTAEKKGRYVKSRQAAHFADLALDATLRAAAPYQPQRKGAGALAVQIRSQDIRTKVREKRMGNFIVFVVDVSGSMGARRRMSAAKGAVMSLLLDAYRMRDHVAMVAFRKNDAELILPPTNTVSLAARSLETMPTGGRTPLSAGLVRGYEVARNRLFKDPLARPIIIVITDGKSNVALTKDSNAMDEAIEIAFRLAREKRIQYVVVDSETKGYLAFGLAERLAEAFDARYYKIEDLAADDLAAVVRSMQHA